MIREVSLALGLVACAICIPGIVNAASDPPPNFYFSIINQNVPLGAPLLLQVVGPPNGTFSVALNPEPFNTSQPVYDRLYQLPATTELSNGSSVGEVSINTSLFAIAAYEVKLASSNSTVFGTSTVFITTGVDATALLAEIEQLQYGAEENASRITSLLYMQGQLQTENLFVVSLAVVLFGIILFLIIATRTAAGEKRFLKSLKRFASKVAFSGKAGMTSGEAGPWEVAERDPKINPEKVWVAGLCGGCELRHTRAALLLHMRNVHRMQPAEAEGYIHISRDARKEILDQFKEDRRPVVRHPPMQSPPPLDLSHYFGSTGEGGDTNAQ